MKTKKTTAFTFLCIAMISLLMLTSCDINRVNADLVYARDHPIERYRTLNDISLGIMDLQRITALIALHAGNTDDINSLEQHALHVWEVTLDNIQFYHDNLQHDPRLGVESLGNYLSRINEIRLLVTEYMDFVVRPVVHHSLADEQNQSILIIREGEIIVEQINEQVDMTLSKYFALLDHAIGW